MDRVSKFEAIYVRAITMARKGTTETLTDLIPWLNQRKFTNDLGEAYSNERGVGQLVSRTYDYFCNELGLGADFAAPIAEGWTNQHGEYPWAQ